jgi:hypothetical protein
MQKYKNKLTIKNKYMITQEMVKKIQNFTQEYVDLIKKGNGKLKNRDVKDLINKYKVSSSTGTEILRAGIVKRINLGVYEVLIPKIEPIHARKVIEARRWYLNNVIKLNVKSKVKKSNTKKDKELDNKYESFKDTELLQQPIIKTRTISILWGLIKINY